MAAWQGRRWTGCRTQHCTRTSGRLRLNSRRTRRVDSAAHARSGHERLAALQTTDDERRTVVISTAGIVLFKSVEAVTHITILNRLDDANVHNGAYGRATGPGPRFIALRFLARSGPFKDSVAFLRGSAGPPIGPVTGLGRLAAPAASFARHPHCTAALCIAPRIVMIARSAGLASARPLLQRSRISGGPHEHGEQGQGNGRARDDGR